MAQYKTPGVYIQETTLFPSSVTAVETALPVFIGYTEKAERLEDAKGKVTPLANVPTRIDSMVQYENMFGGPPAEEVTLWLDAENNIVDAAVNQAFYLYHSLRLFNRNGGGACLIVSVGDYNSEITHTALLQGLEVIKDIAGPTIIVLPEAAQLEDHGTIVYAAALAQCAEVRNRMTLCDLGYQNKNHDFAQEAEDFRDNIGFDHLGYGAAYGPWLLASFTREPRLGNLVLKRKTIGTDAGQADTLLDVASLLGQLTSDVDLKNKVIDVSLTERVCKLLTTGEKRLLNNAPTLKQAAANLANRVTALNSTASITDYQAPLQVQSIWLLTLLEMLSSVVTDCPDTGLITFAGNISSQAQARMADSMRQLIAHHLALLAHTGLSLINETASCPLLGLKDQAAMLAVSPLPEVTAEYVADQTDSARILVAQQALNGIINTAITWFSEIHLSAHTTSRAMNQYLYQQHAVFRTWVDRATLTLNALPTCGAVAGIYAQVDAERGVWKAPANVALNEIIKPVLAINDEEQDDYNVHPTGKSINIIRDFSGKGTLIWGARTLAGNDNEWRYVSVRRFFNFIEASITQSVQAFVFEPNDANTWVKVKAMIENFLVQQWKAGALQGASPEQAFYVAIGLNKTMTALDITEGRMLLEIGMASVRPAEFIVLKFMQKMEQK